MPTAAEADKALAELKSGADFAVLARLNSTDPTAGEGGLMGVIDPSTLRPELRDALRGDRQAAVWADINNDGQLDPFVGAEKGASARGQ